MTTAEIVRFAMNGSYMALLVLIVLLADRWAARFGEKILDVGAKLITLLATLIEKIDAMSKKDKTP